MSILQFFGAALIGAGIFVAMIAAAIWWLNSTHDDDGEWIEFD